MRCRCRSRRPCRSGRPSWPARRPRTCRPRRPPSSASRGPTPKPFEVPERRGVEERGEGVEALARLGLPVVEEIPVGSRHAAIIPVSRLVTNSDSPAVHKVAPTATGSESRVRTALPTGAGSERLDRTRRLQVKRNVPFPQPYPASFGPGRLARQGAECGARRSTRGDPDVHGRESAEGHGLGKVGGLRRVARLARRRPRVDLSHPARSPLGSSVVNCVTYHEGVRSPPAAISSTPCKQVRKHDDGFVWLGLHEPTDREFAGIAELFDLHPLAVEDAVEAHQRPKLERYGDTLFAVFKTVCYVEHTELTATSEVVNTGEIMVFVGAGLRDHGSARTARLTRPAARGAGGRPAAARQGTGRGAARDRGPRGRRLPERHGLGAGGHRPGRDGCVRRRTARGPTLGRIYQLKRELLELKRAVAPARPPAPGTGHTADPGGRPGDTGLLPGRLRPPAAGHGADRRVRRTAELDSAGAPRAGQRRAERGHAEDHGMGGGDRRADDGLRGVRHELRAHAGAALEVRLSAGHWAS